MGVSDLKAPVGRPAASGVGSELSGGVELEVADGRSEARRDRGKTERPFPVAERRMPAGQSAAHR